MSKSIQFYFKSNGEVLESTDDEYFVMNDTVYRDNYRSYESQSAVISFFDCITECSHVDWRAIEK